ncbi:MAG: hypothetical protein M3065_07485 [Actinomycetota bacterium]|nr:hypothetical protein [Actinomycetota bacterium]
MTRRLFIQLTALILLVALVAGGCGPASRAERRTAPPAGPVRNLGPVARGNACRVHGALPDLACTPGAVYANANRAAICRRGYARRERKAHGPSFKQRTAIYRAYAITRRFTGASGEVDHSVPIALGGASTPANLWPEAAPLSHRKDTLEAFLAHEVCAGHIALTDAQRQIAQEWQTAYERYRGRGIERFARRHAVP